MIDIRRYIGYSNTYLVNFHNNDGEYITIIIDPSVPFTFLKKDIKGKVVGIFLTHGHFDHFSALDSLISELGIDTPIYLHKNAYLKLNDSFMSCSQMFGCNYKRNDKYNYVFLDNNFVELNYSNGEKEVLEIINTPGHTNCSITIKYKEYLFTGDFLFNGSIGRTDLYSGNQIDMKKSLDWIKGLIKYDSENDYYIYPGHEEETTLKEELKYNYYLQ